MLLQNLSHYNSHEMGQEIDQQEGGFEGPLWARRGGGRELRHHGGLSPLESV